LSRLLVAAAHTPRGGVSRARSRATASDERALGSSCRSSSAEEPDAYGQAAQTSSPRLLSR
jgi:hypothetical protein